MALEDFKKHLSRGTMTVLATAQMARMAQAKAAEVKVEDAKSFNIENTIGAVQNDLDEKTISLDEALVLDDDPPAKEEDKPDIRVVSEGKEKMVFVNGVSIPDTMLDEKEMKKKFKKNQKELFEKAEPDKIHQDTVKLDQDGKVKDIDENFFGKYDTEDKNIKIPYFDYTSWYKEHLATLDGYFKDLGGERTEEEQAKYTQQIEKDIAALESKIPHNNQNSTEFKSTMVHEEQHRINDKNGIYAPGLSPEQYYVLNCYDEISANIAELNLCTRLYQQKEKDLNKTLKEYPNQVAGLEKSYSEFKEALKSGKSPEDAMKVFDSKFENKEVLKEYKTELLSGKIPDNEEYAMKSFDKIFTSAEDLEAYKEVLRKGNSPDNKEFALKEYDKVGKFDYYKDAVKGGLDPDSKDGKKLMVQGTYDMWVEQQKDNPQYMEQLIEVGKSSVKETSLAALAAGNDKEFQKRLKTIYDNIDGGQKRYGIKGPGNLSEFLPSTQPEVTLDAKQAISEQIKKDVGLTQDQRNHLKEKLGKRNKNKKLNKIVKDLRYGGKKEEKEVKKTNLSQELLNENSNSNIK